MILAQYFISDLKEHEYEREREHEYEHEHELEDEHEHCPTVQSFRISDSKS